MHFKKGFGESTLMRLNGALMNPISKKRQNTNQGNKVNASTRNSGSRTYPKAPVPVVIRRTGLALLLANSSRIV